MRLGRRARVRNPLCFSQQTLSETSKDLESLSRLIVLETLHEISEHVGASLGEW
jgi:hypothetical protein